MNRLLKVLLILVGAVVTSIVYFSYSIYSSYYQGVRSTESYKYAKTVATSLSKYYSVHLKYPNHIDELNLENSEQHYVGKLTLNRKTGIIKIQIAGNSSSEGTLIFSPEIKNNNLSYTCHPLNIPTEYIPKGCTTK